MADVHSSAVRSKNMRAIRTRDTAIEKRLAAILTQQEIPFRVQDKALPGRPDFVLEGWPVVIFVHGCFWHHHHCYLFKVPATRTAFWLDKIAGNVRRDQQVMRQLEQQGWRILIIWECALRGREKLTTPTLTDRLEEWLFAGDGHAEIDGKGIHLLTVPPADP